MPPVVFLGAESRRTGVVVGCSRLTLGTAAGVLGPPLLAAGCYLGQQLAFALRVPPLEVSTVWVPGGLLLAALLLAPSTRWPAYVAAAFVALLAAFADEAPTFLVAVYFLSVLLPIVLVASVLRRSCDGPPRFDRYRDVGRFLALAVLAAPSVIGLVAAAVAVALGLRQNYWALCPRMALTVAATNLTVTPFLVEAFAGREPARPVSAARAAEAGGLAAAVLARAVAFGGDWAGPVAPNVWLLYAPVPLLVWAAVRFGPGGTGLAALAVFVAATGNAARGRGPFAPGDADTVFALQAALLILTVPKLILAAAVRERQAMAGALAASGAAARIELAQLDAVYRATPVGLGFVDRDQRVVRVNDRLAEFIGLPAAAHEGRPLAAVLPPDLLADFEPSIKTALVTGAPVLDRAVSAAGADGRPRAWLTSYFPVSDAAGGVTGVSVVVRDVTDERAAADALARSYAEVRDLAGRLIAAQEAERTRIARDLHDDLNQRLAAVAIGLSTLKRRPPADPAALHAGLDRLQQEVSRLTDDVRRLSHELHPGVLEHAGLVGALRGHCDELRAAHGLAVEFAHAGCPARLPADVALCLYRIAQEALRNVVRHAAATTVRVSLDGAAGRVELRVADDGRGFDPAEGGWRDGLGVQSMTERARLVGGAATVESRPGGGTVVQATVPLGDVR